MNAYGVMPAVKGHRHPFCLAQWRIEEDAAYQLLHWRAREIDRTMAQLEERHEVEKHTTH